jgi:hypothetical protein
MLIEITFNNKHCRLVGINQKQLEGDTSVDRKEASSAVTLYF